MKIYTKNYNQKISSSNKKSKIAFDTFSLISFFVTSPMNYNKINKHSIEYINHNDNSNYDNIDGIVKFLVEKNVHTLRARSCAGHGIFDQCKRIAIQRYRFGNFF